MRTTYMSARTCSGMRASLRRWTSELPSCHSPSAASRMPGTPHPPEWGEQHPHRSHPVRKRGGRVLLHGPPWNLVPLEAGGEQVSYLLVSVLLPCLLSA